MRGFRGGNEPKLREQKMVPRFRGIGSWYQIRVSERERERDREMPIFLPTPLAVAPTQLVHQIHIFHSEPTG